MGGHHVIVLDTHAWIWFIDAPETLGRRAATAIEKARSAGEGLHISCISTWEVHMLATKGRLKKRIDDRLIHFDWYEPRRDGIRVTARRRFRRWH